jgi:glycosyltransferase involved in cell wall biosynthesis
MSDEKRLPAYVLISPARNEAAFIEKTIQSVISQTVLPLKWVIVENGCTDNTAEIVGRYVKDHPFIEIVPLLQDKERSFAGKAQAFNAGCEMVDHLDFEIIGNLDADISFDPDHFEFLLRRFQEDPKLGVAGTVFQEEGYNSATDSFEGQNHVAGQCQMFRRQCLREVGGYVPHRAGGVDWIAVTTARMLGWRTRSFQEKSFFHYRRMGTAGRGRIAAAFSYGEKDYYLGGSPVWQLFRCAYRLVKPPYLIEGSALLAGYLWAWIRRRKRPVSNELMRFHRREQMTKLRTILSSILHLRSFDKFTLNAER